MGILNVILKRCFRVLRMGILYGDFELNADFKWGFGMRIFKIGILHGDLDGDFKWGF